MTTAGVLQVSRSRWGGTIALWGAQILLAAFYGMAGGMHAFLSPDDLWAQGIAWASTAPVWLIRFIGVAELAGVAGILLPALFRIRPSLTPLAALGFTAIQALAIPFHIVRGESEVTPFNLALLALSVFVFWGRAFKAPIASR